MNFDISLPAVLAARVGHVMKERHCSFNEAVFYLIEKVCSPERAFSSPER